MKKIECNGDCHKEDIKKRNTIVKTLKQELAEKTLKEKWLPIKEAVVNVWVAQINGGCAFCRDAENDCNYCMLDETLCRLNGHSDLYHQFTNARMELEKIVYKCIKALQNIINGA